MNDGYWWVMDKHNGRLSIVNVRRDRVAFIGNDMDYPVEEIAEEYDFLEQPTKPATAQRSAQ